MEQVISGEQIQIKAFCNSINDKVLTQIVSDSTWLNNLLDLFFTNDLGSILNVEIIHNNGLSNHNYLKWALT